MGWESVETGRCTKCRVYSEKTDLLFAANGLPYCVTCGVPVKVHVHVSGPDSDSPPSYRPTWKARARTWTQSWWTTRSLHIAKRKFYKRAGVNPNPYAAAVMAIPPMYRNVIQHHVRLIIGAILLVTLCFPIAACVSQL